MTLLASCDSNSDLVTMHAGDLLWVAQPPYAVLTWTKSSTAAGGLVWCQPQSERAAGCDFVLGALGGCRRRLQMIKSLCCTRPGHVYGDQRTCS